MIKKLSSIFMAILVLCGCSSNQNANKPIVVKNKNSFLFKYISPEGKEYTEVIDDVIGLPKRVVTNELFGFEFEQFSMISGSTSTVWLYAPHGWLIVYELIDKKAEIEEMPPELQLLENR